MKNKTQLDGMPVWFDGKSTAEHNRIPALPEYLQYVFFSHTPSSFRHKTIHRPAFVLL